MPWPHAPSKIVKGPGLVIITAGTYHKEHHFRGNERLAVLQDTLFEAALETGWELQAWALFQITTTWLASIQSLMGSRT
jgi:hypothetical protein